MSRSRASRPHTVLARRSIGENQRRFRRSPSLHRLQVPTSTPPTGGRCSLHLLLSTTGTTLTCTLANRTTRRRAIHVSYPSEPRYRRLFLAPARAKSFDRGRQRGRAGDEQVHERAPSELMRRVRFGRSCVPRRRAHT